MWITLAALQSMKIWLKKLVFGPVKKVLVISNTSGARLETYVIVGVISNTSGARLETYVIVGVISNTSGARLETYVIVGVISNTSGARLETYVIVGVISNTSEARLETYVIVGKRGSGTICMNGGAAHLIKKGEEIMIMGFELMNKLLKPKIVLVDKNNKFVKFL